MPFGHILAALIAQLAVGLLTGNWWAGAAAGACFYVGRELTQAEYRWIERFGGGKRANMPWWAAFDPRVWTRKSLLDWLLPTIAVVAVALVV